MKGEKSWDNKEERNRERENYRKIGREGKWEGRKGEIKFWIWLWIWKYNSVSYVPNLSKQN